MKMSRNPARRARKSGFLTVVFLVFMGIMAVLVAINSRQLLHLHRATRLLEHQQVQRLSSAPTNEANAGTNQPK